MLTNRSDTTQVFVKQYLKPCERGKTKTNCLPDVVMGWTGFLITGGYGAKGSVEVFIPSSGSQCSLPNLPKRTYSHIQAGKTLCGGRDDTCYTWLWGEWQQTPNVLNRRRSMAENLGEGILVLGGDEGSGAVDTVLFLDKDLNTGEPLPHIRISLLARPAR